MQPTTSLLGIFLFSILFTLNACKPETTPEPDPEPEPVPVDVIDLSNWYLTLPVDADNDGRVDNIEQPALDNYRNIDRVKPYMYDGLDNSLVFNCPYTGISTTNSSYSRTELREQMVTNDNNVNWTMEDGGIMEGELKMDDISSGHRTIIMQIHGRLTNEQKNQIGASDNDAPPLLKIYWQSNKVRVARKVMVNPNASDDDLLPKSAWEDDDAHWFDEEVDFNRFKLKVIASEGRLEIQMNDESVVYEDIHMARWPFENYFKAGNYLQSTNDGAFAKLRFYTLTVTH